MVDCSNNVSHWRDQLSKHKKNEKSGSIPDHFASQKAWLLSINAMEMRNYQEIRKSKHEQNRKREIGRNRIEMFVLL